MAGKVAPASETLISSGRRFLGLTNRVLSGKGQGPRVLFRMLKTSWKRGFYYGLGIRV